MDLALTSEIAAAAQAPSQEQAGRLAKHNSGSRASQSLAVASLPGTLVPGFVTILCFILGLLAISPVIAIVIAAKSKKNLSADWSMNTGLVIVIGTRMKAVKSQFFLMDQIFRDSSACHCS